MKVFVINTCMYKGSTLHSLSMRYHGKLIVTPPHREIAIYEWDFCNMHANLSYTIFFNSEVKQSKSID